MSETVFGPTLNQFAHVTIPIQEIDYALEKADNVIRPSLGFELIILVIKTYIEADVPEFVNHKAAWEETINILDKLKDDAAETKLDSNFAMVLEPFKIDIDDIFYNLGRMVVTFDSLYKNYVGNKNSNSFGKLTPAEALKIIYKVLYPYAPTSHWSYGRWKEADEEIRGYWHTWPWFEYVQTAIRKTYTDMEEVFNFTPGGNPPWSWGRQ